MMSKSYIVIFLSLLAPNQINAQKQLISKDSALSIAIADGMETGLKEYQINLKQDTIWEVTSLICDDYSQSNYDMRQVNAINGKIIIEKYRMAMATTSMEFSKIDKTQINTNFKTDTLPVVDNRNVRKLTGLSEGLSNPTFSLNDKHIAFKYDYNKIGIVSTEGSNFKQICDSCESPQWVSNEWIAYYKKNGYFYKKNIFTNKVIRITIEPIYTIDCKISPDTKWIAYTSMEVWPKVDSSGKQLFYSSINGSGINLCLLSVDGKCKKFITKVWEYVNRPFWTPNSDTILFYISDKKYYATGLNCDTINYFSYNLIPNLNLWDNGKSVNGLFAYKWNCQILEIDKIKLSPKRILVSEIGRYGDLQLSHNLQYLIFAKRNSYGSDISLWIKEINKK